MKIITKSITKHLGGHKWHQRVPTRLRVAPRLGSSCVFASGVVIVIAILVALRLHVTPVNVPAPPRSPERNARSSLVAGIRHLAHSASGDRADILRDFYRGRGFAPLWTSTEGPTPDGWSFLRRLSERDELGSRSSVSELTEIGHLLYVAYPERQEPQRNRVSRLEWELSMSFLRLADQLLRGHVSPQEQRGWLHEVRSTELGAVLADVANRGLEAVVEELERAHEAETGLVAALERYREIRRAGGWRAIPTPETTLEPGARGSSVVRLRERLAASGDLGGGDTAGDVYDAELEAALRRFQYRHGLEKDGIVGKETLAALNVPVEERLRQIAVNLERRRWLPGRFGDDYVWVNVPEFRLYAYRGGELAREMRIVVGKKSTPTPLFSDRLQYVVFHPFWNVPESIAVGELMPHHARDPEYLQKRRYELVNRDAEPISVEALSAEAIRSGEIRIRRLPGAFNDLGRVKFMMPNRHNIYLHDTPSRHLFERASRAFSHGCIRLENPVEFATYVFEGQKSASEIDGLLRGGPDVTVGLTRFVPVYIVYFTAFMRDDVVHFREDIYGHDEAVWAALVESGNVDPPFPGRIPLVAMLEPLGP